MCTVVRANVSRMSQVIFITFISLSLYLHLCLYLRLTHFLPFCLSICRSVSLLSPLLSFSASSRSPPLQKMKEAMPAGNSQASCLKRTNVLFWLWHAAILDCIRCVSCWQRHSTPLTRWPPEPLDPVTPLTINRCLAVFYPPLSLVVVFVYTNVFCWHQYRWVLSLRLFQRALCVCALTISN